MFNRIYGARKIQEELRKGGDWISRKRIRRLMCIEGLVPVSWRRSVRTTVSDPKASPFPNLLKQDFKVALPNRTWVSDFTYVPTEEGWLYLCTFVDLFSRRVVGWAVSGAIDRQLAIVAFRNAVTNRHPGQRLVDPYGSRLPVYLMGLSARGRCHRRHPEHESSGHALRQRLR